MEESLEELEHKYFVLQMVDTWDDADYRYASELREKIKQRRENIKES